MLIKFHRWKTTSWCRSVDWLRLTLRVVLVTAVMAMVMGCFVFSRSLQYSEFLSRSLKGTIPFDDPELLEYIRNECLVPPSTEPYNLLGKRNTALIAVESSELFYGNITKELFKNMRDGVFIEAGALDGETMSNTIVLEKKFGWTGLLVEADPVSYQMLKNTKRKAWSANACLSPHPYPSKELMSSTTHYTGPSSMSAGTKGRAMHSLVSYRKGSGLTNSWYKKVQCFPLQSLLLALQIKHVDLFVLDVEGAEMDILKHFPFEKFEIDVIYLEWKNRLEHKEIAKEIDAKGYHLYNQAFEDLVFVRKGSKYDSGVPYIIPTHNKTLSDEDKKTIDALAAKGLVLNVG